MESLVINAETLTERFDGWPSFHDAEVLGVRLDSGQRSNGVATLELDIHLFQAGNRKPDGSVEWINHNVATLLFEQIQELDLGGFGTQNVLFDLRAEKEIAGPVPGRVEVELESSHGLSAGFLCGSIMVLSVVPHDPGPFSVYGQDR